ARVVHSDISRGGGASRHRAKGKTAAQRHDRAPARPARWDELGTAGIIAVDLESRLLRPDHSRRELDGVVEFLPRSNGDRCGGTRENREVRAAGSPRDAG